MSERFSEMLVVGGKTNSLGRSNEVIEAVLNDKNRLNELYDCLLNEDPWVRMRGADALEKVCRLHPNWIEPFVDRLLTDFSNYNQASIQWHLAQIYRQTNLTKEQKRRVISWLKELLSDVDIDWIVSSNAMDTLVKFSIDGHISNQQAKSLLEVQLNHKSEAVVKRAKKLLAILSAKGSKKTLQ